MGLYYKPQLWGFIPAETLVWGTESDTADNVKARLDIFDAAVSVAKLSPAQSNSNSVGWAEIALQPHVYLHKYFQLSFKQVSS